jgi:hypothetical protein
LSTVLALWRRFPVVVRAVLTGLVVATAGTTPWAVLVSANTKHLSVVPWAVPPTALYLWLFWRYVRGAGWPRSTVYGTLAYLTKSILPSLVLHAGGNVLSAFDLSARGRSEWQASRNPKQLIWVTGPMGRSGGATLIVGAAAVWAYAALASVVRNARARVPPNPHLQQTRA